MLFIIIGELKYFRGSILQFDQGLSISENQSINQKFQRFQRFHWC